LMRILAMDTMRPEEILSSLNDRLCAGNDTSLFVTLFCGFLDVHSGSFVYSNGGHCAPMVCGDRGAALLPVPKGMLVGAASGRRYSSLERNLAVGETLFCYTDGVTEAEAGRRAVPGERCLERLRNGAASPLPRSSIACTKRSSGHCGSRLLADDCTCWPFAAGAAGWQPSGCAASPALPWLQLGSPFRMNALSRQTQTTSIAFGPIGGDAAWRGEDLALQPGRWTYG